MCTITLEYNQNSALARRKLAALLATGLFVKKEISHDDLSSEDIKTYQQEREAFLAHSKESMSNVIARYL